MLTKKNSLEFLNNPRIDIYLFNRQNTLQLRESSQLDNKA